MALILYLSLYWHPLPCDLKGPSTRRQSSFPCCLILSLAVWLTLAKGMLAVMTQSEKSTWSSFGCALMLLPFLENMPMLAPWRMRDMWSQILPAKATLDQPIGSWRLNVWTSSAKYRITALHIAQTVSLTFMLFTLYHWVLGIRCQIASLWKLITHPSSISSIRLQIFWEWKLC